MKTGKLNSNYKHGASWSPTYRSWRNMRRRCRGNSCSQHARSVYRDRGIVVCERWLGERGFENFIADMGERPDGKTLDRIDGNGNYEPGNCRWATPREQTRNSRTAKLTIDTVHEIHGRCEHGETQRAVADRFGIAQSTISMIRSGVNWPETLNGRAP